MKKFLIVFYLCFFLSNLFADYAGKNIKEINFIGLKQIKLQDIREELKSYIGVKYSDELFDALQVSLYALDYFDGLIKPEIKELSENDIAINFYVKEKPIVKSIKFNGNSLFSESEFTSKIETKLKKALNRAELKRSTQIINELYKNNGYLDSKVESDFSEEAENGVSVVFNITAGPKYIVRQIDFEQNFNIQSAKIKRVLVSGENSLFFDGKYIKENIERDIERIESLYKNNGYLQAKVKNYTVDFQDPPAKEGIERNVFIKYFINEGALYKFGEITIRGNKTFTREELLSSLNFLSGDVYDESKAELLFNSINQQYASFGYIFTQITFDKVLKDEFVNLIFNVKEKDKAHINTITVSGNKKTNNEVILREIPLLEGEIFNLEALRIGLTNLGQLGYFGNVIPDIKPSNLDGLMDINFEVQEKGTANLQFGINFGGQTNTQFPFSLFGQWEENNFLGKGYSLSSKLQLSFFNQSLSFNFRDSWFLNKRITLGGGIELSHSINRAYQDNLAPLFEGKEEVPDPFTSRDDYLKSKNFQDFTWMNYNLVKLTMRAYTGYSYVAYLGKFSVFGGLSVGLKYVNYNKDLVRPSNYYLRQNLGKVKFENSLWAAVSWDTRNSILLANDGFVLRQQMDIVGGFLFGQSHYTKSTTSFERGLSLLGKRGQFNPNFDLVLTYRSTYINILPPLGNNFEREVQTEDQISISENFMQARGWGVQQGLYSAFINTVQISIPLLSNILVWDIFFLDFVAYSRNPKVNALMMSSSDLALSWGTTIRSILPQLPLAFVLAQPFKFENGSFKLHTIGQQFGGFRFFIAIDISY